MGYSRSCGDIGDIKRYKRNKTRQALISQPANDSLSSSDTQLVKRVVEATTTIYNFFQFAQNVYFAVTFLFVLVLHVTFR